jgi:hypothetical protein
LLSLAGLLIGVALLVALIPFEVAATPTGDSPTTDVRIKCGNAFDARTTNLSDGIETTGGDVDVSDLLEKASSCEKRGVRRVIFAAISALLGVAALLGAIAFLPSKSERPE